MAEFKNVLSEQSPENKYFWCFGNLVLSLPTSLMKKIMSKSHFLDCFGMLWSALAKFKKLSKQTIFALKMGAVAPIFSF